LLLREKSNRKVWRTSPLEVRAEEDILFIRGRRPAKEECQSNNQWSCKTSKEGKKKGVVVRQAHHSLRKTHARKTKDFQKKITTERGARKICTVIPKRGRQEYDLWGKGESKKKARYKTVWGGRYPPAKRRGGVFLQPYK